MQRTTANQGRARETAGYSECSGLTLLQLVRIQLPQLVHLGALSRYGTLGHLHSTTQHVLVVDCVCCRLCSNLDDANSWVVRSTIVLAVTEVTDPSLQSRRVVFLDSGAVGKD